MISLIAFLAIGLQESEERKLKLATVPDAVRVVSFAFDREGNTVAYIMEKEGSYHVVAGDWTAGPFRQAAELHLSPDGKHVGFMGTDVDGSFIQVNKKIIARNDHTWAVGWGLAMSSDGSHVAYLMRDQQRGLWRIMVDGKQIGDVSARPRWPALSADGRTIAYSVQGGDKEYIVVGENRGPEFDYVTAPVLSTNGKVVAYGAEVNDQNMLVRGSVKSPLPSWPSTVFISPDGSAAGCVLSRLEGDIKYYCVWAHGSKGEDFQMIQYRPVLSPDGKTACYAATKGGKNYIMIGDRKIECSSIVAQPAWRSDGRAIGYGTQLGRDLWWKEIKVK